MSQDSLLKLADYNFVKRPTMMSGNLNSSADVTTPSRRRIIEIHDSDSDVEVVDDPDDPISIPDIVLQPPVVSPVNSQLSTVKIDVKPEIKNHIIVKPVITAPTVTALNKTNDSVIEKEMKVKYLIKMFVGTQSFEIYQVLSQCGFDITLAVQRLEEKHKTTAAMDFETWKIENPHTPSTTMRSTYTVNANNYKVITNTKTTESNGNTSASSGSSTSLNASGVKRKVEYSNKKAKKPKIDEDDDSNDSVNVVYNDMRVFGSDDDDSDAEITDELTGDKEQVLEFLQRATPNELQLMASCSKKKIDAIIASRPFQGWIDLVQKLQENKNLSTDLLNSAQQVLTTRSNIKQLMKKCASLSERLENAISNKPSISVQPKIISPGLNLTSYQLVGVNWLTVLHHQDVNGILADEMGLGKTIQVIAFLAHLKETKAAKTTHMVVVPSSTLENWQNEFQRWCPELNVLLYYGNTEERRAIRALFYDGIYKEYDVVLTTYTVVSTSPEEKKLFRVTPMHYIVFDEAHMLKNMNTQRYESLIRIKAMKRILLTGTPLQNNLLELMSLLIFVMPNIFSEKTEDLKHLFQKTTKSKDQNNDALPEFEKDQIEHAKRIMKPFVLRRLKRDVLQDLPKKEDYMLETPMAPTQEEQYVNLVASFKAAGNSGNTNYNGVTMMSDLRKLSNHPLLLRYHYQYEDLPAMAKRLAADPGYKDTVEKYIIDDLACMSDFEIHRMTKEFKCLEDFTLPDNLVLTSGKFLFLDKKLKELKETRHKVLIFSQYVIMLDVLEEYMHLRDHKYSRLDGSTPVTIRQQLIDQFSEDPSIFIFLLSTKAGGLGINLTAADTVIIHDIDFNPYNDKQAEDRCHRMGQHNPVTVYRLISRGTIEEGMWQLTQEKLKLEKEITSDDYENTDVKSVVNLLSSALGISSTVATDLVSPKKKS